MSELKNWQRVFQQQLFDSNNQKLNPETDDKVRWAVYQNAYRSRLIETLKRDYTTLHALLGETAFDSLSNDYIDSHPSTFYSIRWFGKSFSQFLRQHPHYADNKFYFEMAQFEWALTEAFDAKNSVFITAQHMLNVQPENWPNLQFNFHASLRYFDFQWNVIPIWKTHSKESHLIQTCSSPTKTTWMIWRRKFDIHFRSLSVEESWALMAALNRQPFSLICEGLCQWIDEPKVSYYAASLIKKWLDEGLIVDFNIQKQ